jgi:hypothetical protein
VILSGKQLALFWSLWAKAEREELPSSASQSERDVARRSVLFRACGKVSLKDVSPGREFDLVMSSVASLAGDYKAMAYWILAGERRTAHMIGECARQIGEIAGVHHGWKYCRETFIQAGLPESWMDIPEGLLTSVFQMLDTHRRRMLKRDCEWNGSRYGQPLGFQPTRIYTRIGSGASYYDPAPAPHPTSLSA